MTVPVVTVGDSKVTVTVTEVTVGVVSVTEVPVKEITVTLVRVTDDSNDNEGQWK